MTDEAPVRGLLWILQGHRAKKTAAEISADCGGVPSLTRVKQLSTKKLISFPGVDVIQGLARGLGMSNLDVVIAIARDIGLTGQEASDTLIINGAGHLPVQAHIALQNLVSVWDESLTARNSVSQGA